MKLFKIVGRVIRFNSVVGGDAGFVGKSTTETSLSFFLYQNRVDTSDYYSTTCQHVTYSQPPFGSTLTQEDGQAFCKRCNYANMTQETMLFTR